LLVAMIHHLSLPFHVCERDSHTHTHCVVRVVVRGVKKNVYFIVCACTPILMIKRICIPSVISLDAHHTLHTLIYHHTHTHPHHYMCVYIYIIYLSTLEKEEKVG
jgi:hypothetical protein